MNTLNSGRGASLTPSRLQYGMLMLTGIMEALLIIHRATDRVETYMVVPTMIFLGMTLVTEKSRAAKRDLIIGAVCVLWFCAVQEIHRTTEGAYRPWGLFSPAYLLAFPFASACRGRARDRGLRDFSYLYLAAVLLLCAGSYALLLKILPESLEIDFHWDGTRLYATGYPTIMACPLMIAIAFCLGQAYRLEKWWMKAVYSLLMVVILVAQALTNDRTTILLTDALIGGSVFFTQWGKGWKRVLAGFFAAIVLLVGLYAGATVLYDANTAALQKDFYDQQAAQAEEPAPEQGEPVPGEAAAPEQGEPAPAEGITPEQGEPAQGEDVPPEQPQPAPAEEAPVEETAPAVVPDSGERSLLADLGTLNGRTLTWKAAIDALKANPRILLYGVNDVVAAIPDLLPLIEHTHNSYLEIVFWLGLPGLAMALYFSFLALKAGLRLLFGTVPMYRKCAALLCLCLLANGMLEPLLFTGANYYHYLNFFFFLALGYIHLWESEMPSRKKQIQ